MLSTADQYLQSVYPVTCSLLTVHCEVAALEDLPALIRNTSSLCSGRPYLADLAAIEFARYRVGKEKGAIPAVVQSRMVNPSLELLVVQWRGIPAFMEDQESLPSCGEEWILILQRTDREDVEVFPASSHDLLALKIVSEGISSADAAHEGGVSVGMIDDILTLAVQRGLLLSPPSRLVRTGDFFLQPLVDPRYLTTPTFALQWHITQNCDLHCRHCYDRSDRVTMKLEQGIQVLEQLYAFTQSHHVFSQVTFTGGNPLLYPHFNALYQEAADRGFMTAILGNPMSRERIEQILTLRMPEFYQVSLEGLREHNDYIRGEGHFQRTLEFLDLLRHLGIYSMVMLTLTRANMKDVLPLAELLRDRVDLFTFNRLAMVGEGAALASVVAEDFPEFLQTYLQAAQDNPCMGVKDNLFNLLHYEQGRKMGGGCAGYGCGAAFNFVSLLPDGEVHACRKLPSLIGNIYHQSLDEIYHSPQAEQYRRGPESCRGCNIRPFCGGCLAVAYGYGLDIFRESDPYCWKVREI